jgi:hypothetical protein
VKIIYFVSPTFDFGTVIYPGVGPRYARSFGWPTAPIDALSRTPCDVASIDNRLTPADRVHLDRELVAPERNFPVRFKLSDPEAPNYRDEGTRYIFAQRDAPGVHYLSIYDPQGPLLDFVASLRRSQVLRLPFPYDAAREVERDMASRRRRVLLSGAQSPAYYPLRHRLHRRRRYDPLLRLAVAELPHPGYADVGQGLRHHLVFEAFIAHAAQFTHFFLCPSRYRVEFMKYVECGYAGSVPIGEPPSSLAPEVKDCFIVYAGKARDLLRALAADRREMAERAAAYRAAVRKLRDPATLVSAFEAQINARL